MWSFSIVSLFFLSWQSVLLFLVIAYFISVIGQIMGLHRYFAHKSFSTNKFWHYFILFCSTVITLGSPIAWVAVHLKHHRFSDTEKDSHSPVYKGHFKVFFGYFYDVYDVEPKYAARLLRDKDQIFIHKNYFKLHTAYIVFLLAIDPVLVFPLYFYPTILSVVMGGMVNVFNHWNGTISDNKLIAWAVAGEGWHKYHHDNASKWRNPYPDLCGFLINLIRIKK
tara:strand:- start:23 stop:691 length:669 start_codon:yes stop_codon:yes gene_type:complete